MGLLILLQVALDLGFIAIVTLLLLERFNQKNTEDPRLSRGLQLLSSKIAILQDLMDRSETLGRQLTQMIDHKQQDVQERVEEIETHLQKVRLAIEKSEEVAKIFQDRIPHREIIERQNTLKYVQAAKLAYQGVEVSEIARQVDIPRGELELIAKLNRGQILGSQVPQDIQTQSQTAGGQRNSQEFDSEMIVTQGASELPRVQVPSKGQYQIQNQTPAPSSSQVSTKQEEPIRPVIFRKVDLP